MSQNETMNTEVTEVAQAAELETPVVVENPAAEEIDPPKVQLDHVLSVLKKAKKVKTPKSPKPPKDKKMPAITKAVPAAKVAPAAKAAPAAKTKVEKVEKTGSVSMIESGKIKWTEKRVAIVKAMRALQATNATSAATADAIAEKASVLRKDVVHYCWKDNELVMMGYVKLVKESNKVTYFLTAKGSKAEF